MGGRAVMLTVAARVGIRDRGQVKDKRIHSGSLWEQQAAGILAAVTRQKLHRERGGGAGDQVRTGEGVIEKTLGRVKE